MQQVTYTINRLYIQSNIMTNAQSNNAIAIEVEHRFYGLTHPTPDLSMESLKYLTSQQVRGRKHFDPSSHHTRAGAC